MNTFSNQLLDRTVREEEEAIERARQARERHRNSIITLEGIVNSRLNQLELHQRLPEYATREEINQKLIVENTRTQQAEAIADLENLVRINSVSRTNTNPQPTLQHQHHPRPPTKSITLPTLRMGHGSNDMTDTREFFRICLLKLRINHVPISSYGDYFLASMNLTDAYWFTSHLNMNLISQSSNETEWHSSFCIPFFNGENGTTVQNNRDQNEVMRIKYENQYSLPYADCIRLYASKQNTARIPENRFMLAGK
jgi:hypothetical protein